MGEDQTPAREASLDAYARRVCGVLAEGEPAVLVGHSMGGMSITQAAARCPERVVALVYVAAFLPAEGQSLAELVSFPEAAGDQVQANLEVGGDPPVGTLSDSAARHALFNCCTDERAAWAVSHLRGQPVAPFGQAVSFPADRREEFARLPRAYVFCGQDHAVPPAMQRRMLTDAGCAPVLEIDTDHSPMISRPDELVAALTRIVGDVAAATV
jgi:pimeloyl-ACP methyl ester carboxylesterase